MAINLYSGDLSLNSNKVKQNSGIRNFVPFFSTLPSAVKSIITGSVQNKIKILLLAFCLCSPLVSSEKREMQTPERVYRVAIDGENQPFEFINDNNLADGFIPSLLRKIENASSVKFEFIPMNWEDALRALEYGTIDLVSMVYSTERTRTYEFSKPFGQIAQALFRSTNAKEIVDTTSLKGYTIGFQSGDIAANKMAHRTDFAKRFFDTKVNGLLHLNVGNIDALFCTEYVGLHFISQYKFTNIELVKGNLFTQDFDFASRKGNTEIILLLNKYIDEYTASGELKKLNAVWFPGEENNASWFQKNKEELLKISGLIGSLFLLLVLWNFSLHKKVASKTKTLRINETLYRRLFETSPAGKLLINEEGKILETNAMLCKTLGYTHEELVGKDINILAPATSHERVKKNLAMLLTGKTLDHEVVNQKKDGSQCYFHLKESVVTLPDGNKGILSVAIDISDQKRAEEEKNSYLTTLEESEEKYRTLTDTAVDIIVSYAFDGKITYLNQAGLSILNLSKNDYYGKSLFTFIPQKYHEGLKRNLREREAGFLERRISELELIDGKGNVFPIESATSPILINGTLTGFISIARDITERKLAEAKLKESEEKYRLLVENAQDMVGTLNPDGRLTYISASTKRFSGFTVTEIEGEHFSKYFADEIEKENAFALFKKIINEKETISYEFHFLPKDHDPFWVEVVAKPIIENENVAEVHFIMRNIDERKKAEEKIKTQMDELQKWYASTIGREERIIEMKKEVNELLTSAGKPRRYEA